LKYCGFSVKGNVVPEKVSHSDVIAYPRGGRKAENVCVRARPLLLALYPLIRFL
jgi:hypothetical protein